MTEARAEVTGCAIFENSTVCQIVDDFVPVFVAAFVVVADVGFFEALTS